MQVYAGSRNVTNQFYDFYDINTNPGRSPDGSLRGNETEAYLGILPLVQDLTGGSDERFAAYAAFVSGDCENNHGVDAIIVGLYEEVLQFIESDAFESARPEYQNAATGLAVDLITQLWTRGIDRPDGLAAEDPGTSIEDPVFNPTTEPFMAYPEVLSGTDRVIPVLGVDNLGGDCLNSVIDFSASAEEPVSYNVYGREGATGGNAFSDPEYIDPADETIVNIDYRFYIHQGPVIAPAETAPEPRHIELDLDRH